MLKLDSKFLSYGKHLYVSLKNNNPDVILLEEPDNIAFKALKGSLINPPAMGHPSDQMPLFLFVYEKKGNALGVLTPKHINL